MSVSLLTVDVYKLMEVQSQREKNNGAKERGNDVRGLSLSWGPRRQLIYGGTRKEGGQWSQTWALVGTWRRALLMAPPETGSRPSLSMEAGGLYKV